MQVAFVRRSPTAQLPTKATLGSVGYDLRSDQEVMIGPGERALVSTGFALALCHASNVYARIAPRSGLALHGIDVVAGVCDSDYRGEYKVVLANNSKDVFEVCRGDRIAQLIFEAVAAVEFVERESVDATSRADGGFGSSGSS